MEGQVPPPQPPSLYFHHSPPSGEKANEEMANARGSSNRHAADGRCKKHPKHQQSPGVCALCLSKKLSQLSTGNSRSLSIAKGYACASLASSSSSVSSSSYMSSYHSSSDGSSCSSPVYRHSRTIRGASSGPITMLFGAKDVLKKSRSIAFASKMTSGEYKERKHEKSKGGFWSKLISRKKRVMRTTGEEDGLRLKPSTIMRQ